MNHIINHNTATVKKDLTPEVREIVDYNMKTTLCVFCDKRFKTMSAGRL